MSPDAWLTIAVVFCLLASLIANIAPPDLLFLTAIAALTLMNIITPSEAFTGFSNEGMLTVGMLFVIAAGLKEAGLLDKIGHRILGGAQTSQSALLRLAIVLFPLSAFLNNTPVVAMFVPIVMDWCRRSQVAPSKLLIPVSFMTILGGTCTLIGTSTNLVVNGMMIETGMPGMSLFEISWVGVPYAIIGFAYLLLIGPRLLPERKELFEQLGDSRREYMAEMLVESKCRLIGQQVGKAGLRHLPGLFLVEINRDDEILTPVAPDEVIQENDVLVFTGVVSSIIELERIPGLTPVIEGEQKLETAAKRRERMCEAVISASSPLIGQTVREADFRANYGAAIIAVHRSGSRVEEKIGDIRLKPGDTLLLQTGPNFERAHRNDPTFYLVSNVSEYQASRDDKTWIALGLLILLIFLMSSGVVSTLIAATTVAILMIATGCLTTGDARRNVDWQVLVTIAAAFGVGIALEKTGAAAAVAGQVVTLIGDANPIIALAVMYLMVSLVTEMITNNAAAVLMFPICIETARLYGASPRPFVMALILAASASFMTPVGYQTNMMVYGPGGYKFTDFMRIGGLLHLVLLVVAVILIPLVWPLHP